MSRSKYLPLTCLFAQLVLSAAADPSRPASDAETSLEQARGSDPRSVYLIGDSTMAPKAPERRPEMGWGEALQEFFDGSVRVENHAINGRSSKSFLDEGRWDVVMNKLQPGDYVVAQFGHNDEKEHDPSRFTAPWGTYADNLKRFAAEARAKGAEVILLTSICRRKFAEDGTLLDTHGEYPDAVRAVADEIGSPLVDLEKASRAMLVELGDEASRELFLHLEAGENANYPDGVVDDTHLVRKGAEAHARLFIEGLREVGHPLVERLAEANAGVGR